MQKDDEPPPQITQFIIIIAFVALVAGASIAIIGFVIGAHVAGQNASQRDGSPVMYTSSNICAPGP